MFNIGPGELIVILILALVLLGPEKLPEVARTLGKGMKELRRATEDVRNTVEQELYRADQEIQKPLEKTPPPVTAFPSTYVAAKTEPAALPAAVEAPPTDPPPSNKG